MKVRFTTSICGEGWAHSQGDTLDVSKAAGARLINAGFAVPVPAEEQPLETATAPEQPTEKATVRTKRKAK